jgi:hypothetical protein
MWVAGTDGAQSPETATPEIAEGGAEEIADAEIRNCDGC